jgi:hypothetical protein
MRSHPSRLAAAVCALALVSCKYVVFPDEEEDGSAKAKKGWSAEAIKVERTAAGDLRVELAIRNDTGDWSAMKALPKPARLVTKDGTKPCETVTVSSGFVSAGGHRLAPGFRMRGFVGGLKMEQQLQPIAVECKGAEAARGAKLLVDYVYWWGQFNYYQQTRNEIAGTLEVNLDEVKSDLDFPVADAPDKTIVNADAPLTGMNGVVVTLASVTRDDEGVVMNWKTANPGDYPSYVHLGVTPLIGSDGILYGFYEVPDLVSVPITPGKGTAQWSTKVGVPKDVKDLHIMLSVETGKKGLFQNYAVDLSGKLPRG